MGRIIAGKTSDITPGKMIKVSIDGRDILVANIDGKYCRSFFNKIYKRIFDNNNI